MATSRITRRRFIQELGVGAASLAVFPPLSSHRTTASRPNILFIMSDDHAYQAISCYGSKINRTPNIDRLAQEGVRFTRSFCTNSLCAPSRAVLLTGKYSHLNGVIDNVVAFDGTQETFPKILQRADYTTALFGKWHLKSDPTGFDYWNILPGQGDYYNPAFIEMGRKGQREGYVTDLITDDCLNWIRQQKSGKPFCALLHHKAPHRNWMPDGKHLSMYEGEDIPLPETFFDDYATRSDAARQQKMRIADRMAMGYDLKLDSDTTNGLPSPQALDDQWNMVFSRLNEEQKRVWREAYGPRNEAFRKSDLKGDALTKWKYERYIKDYLRCIASIDDNVGRVLDYFDQSGLVENTIVVYTSDQGSYLGEHGWFDKRFMYEESLRMPLIIRYPAEIRPRAADEMVLNLDFAPTFLDFAGASIPEDMQGESLRGVLKGTTPETWRRSIYYHYYEYPGSPFVKRHYGIRTERHKLMHFYYDIDAWELYDLQADPHELKNVYSDPRYGATVIELKGELERLRRQYKDTDEKKFLPSPKDPIRRNE
ncbi:MAG: Sulfatase [Bacteroidetes bacterium]|nr:Sulfatase [Bacteroidota bacterium]